MRALAWPCSVVTMLAVLAHASIAPFAALAQPLCCSTWQGFTACCRPAK